jgi:hypothetical protein
MGLMVLDYYETAVVGSPYLPPREVPSTPARISKPSERVPAATNGTPTIEAEEQNAPGNITPIEREINNGQHTALRQEQDVADSAPSPTSAAPSSEMDRVAAHRATLLAKRYETRHLSREQETRLEMLNERLKILLPPVTEEELVLIEQMALEAKRAAARVAKIKHRFGLG